VLLKVVLGALDSIGGQNHKRSVVFLDHLCQASNRIQVFFSLGRIGHVEGRVLHAQGVQQPLLLELIERFSGDHLDQTADDIGRVAVIPGSARLVGDRQLGVALADRLSVSGYVELSSEGGAVTEAGLAFLRAFGVDLDTAPRAGSRTGRTFALNISAGFFQHFPPCRHPLH